MDDETDDPREQEEAQIDERVESQEYRQSNTNRGTVIH